MNKLKGFTLIELVIAIFILSIAVIGISNAFNIVNILTSDSSDRLTATYLAQEGMEIVSNIRDTNWLNMDNDCKDTGCVGGNAYSWVDGLTIDGIHDSVDCTAGCKADYTYTRFVSPGEDYLNINADGLFYGYGSGTQTKFKRKIIITNVEDIVDDPPPYHIIKVRVEVSWNARATLLNPGDAAGTCVEGKNCIATEETLYNWYFPNH